jgi:hypothetical protein
MQRPAEPVEPPDRQYVAGAGHLHRQGETKPCRRRATDPILVNLLAARRPQRVSPQVEILIIGRDACIADQHGIPGGQETHPN